MNKISVSYFSKIDILRFISAMMVVVYHAYWRLGDVHAGLPNSLFYDSVFSPGRWIEHAVKNFDFGVDIFFLLSGFLITYLLINEKSKFNTINLRNFYLRRILRIWPLYYLLVFTAPFIASWFNINPAPVYTNALFINNFWVIEHGWWVFPTAMLWSICIEEHFYLVWPILLSVFNIKRLPYVFISVIFISFLYRGYVAFINNENAWFKLYLHTFSRMDALAVGALTAYYYFLKPFRFKTHWLIRVFAIITFVIMFCTMYVREWNSAFEILVKNQIFLALVWFIILQFLFNEKPLLKLPEKSILNYFGKVSYGIYMYGLIILHLVQEKILTWLNVNDHYFLIYWILVIVLSILIPIVSYELFEKYFLRLKEKLQVVRPVES